MVSDNRSDLIERESYEYLKWPLDEFIVPLLKEKIDFTLKEFASNPKAGSRVLDIGSGGQPYRRLLEKIGYQYFSLDPVESVEAHVDFVAEIDKQLPDKLIDVQKFDLLFCTEVMEHVADWERAFKNFELLLAPGGKMIVTCPFFFMLHEEPFDFWRPTLNALMYFANKVNLTTIYCEKAGTPWDVLGTLLLTVDPYVNLKKNTIIERARNRVLRDFIMTIRTLAIWILKKRIVQKYIALRGEIYLSNVVVFQK